MNAPEISIVVPLYNEEKSFPLLIRRLSDLLGSIELHVQVVLVNDGSSDNTPYLMEMQSKKDPRFKSVFLSRNHGHQLAVSAGMHYTDAQNAIMIIDGDLQDPPELLPEFYEKIREGFDVIYAVRKNRKENVVIKFAYWSYYRLQKMVSNYNIPLDSGDFCMISKRVRDIMVAMPESSRYLRGMRSWVGFRQFAYAYDRVERQAGKSKYSLKKLTELAFNGIFNFTSFPVRLMYRLGFLSIIFSMIYIVYLLILKFRGDVLPEGYVTLIFSISFFSGVQLLCLGLIGEYVYRMYNQVRERPLFIVDKIIN
ncbi:glycosyltransferase family 2 protein [Puia sp. P3]|uniref:glycosyltransferase family 2 protein n=1 Tax=Puia sp. P3 TaxID=3423952 RepID=UPI003D668E48